MPPDRAARRLLARSVALWAASEADFLTGCALNWLYLVAFWWPPARDAVGNVLLRWMENTDGH